jgi:hypothetical protein
LAARPGISKTAPSAPTFLSEMPSKTILPEIRASKKEGENEIMFLQNKHIKSSG